MSVTAGGDCAQNALHVYLPSKPGHSFCRPHSTQSGMCPSLPRIVPHTHGGVWVSGEVIDSDVSGFKVQLEFSSIPGARVIYSLETQMDRKH